MNLVVLMNSLRENNNKIMMNYSKDMVVIKMLLALISIMNVMT